MAPPPGARTWDLRINSCYLRCKSLYERPALTRRSSARLAEFPTFSLRSRFGLRVPGLGSAFAEYSLLSPCLRRYRSLCPLSGKPGRTMLRLSISQFDPDVDHCLASLSSPDFATIQS